jgi:hypothetical protein
MQLVTKSRSRYRSLSDGGSRLVRWFRCVTVRMWSWRVQPVSKARRFETSPAVCAWPVVQPVRRRQGRGTLAEMTEPCRSVKRPKADRPCRIDLEGKYGKTSCRKEKIFSCTEPGCEQGESIVNGSMDPQDILRLLQHGREFKHRRRSQDVYLRRA